MPFATFVIFILLLLGCLSLSQVQLVVVSILSLLLLIFRFCPLSRFKRVSYGCFFLGFLVPWLPSFGGLTLMLVALVFLLLFYLDGLEVPIPCSGDDRNGDHIGKDARSVFSTVSWALPILSIIATWSICEIIFSLNVDTIRELQALMGESSFSWLYAMASWFTAAPPPIQIVSSQFSILLIVVGMSSLLQQNPQWRSSFINGVLLGMIPACALFIAQILGVHSQYFVNQNEFFSSLNRLSGSFSDPNAAGVFLFLIMPIIWIKGSVYSRSIAIGAVGLVVLLASYSGSRSFWLGSAIIALILARRYRVPRFCLLVAILSVLLLNIASLVFPISEYLSNGKLPTGVVRLVNAVVFENYHETFFSRAAFVKIAGRALLDHWFLGLGYGHFRMWVPIYAEQLQLGTGVWTDNPNNFYLGILVELGIVGFIALAITVGRFRFLKGQPNDGAILKYAFVAFIILLITGPHLDFVEVSLLFSWYLASTCTLRGSLVRSKALGGALVVLLAILIAANSYFLERGFYYWEDSPEGRFRWVSHYSQGYLSCGSDNKTKISVRAANPDLGQRPVSLKISLPHYKEVIEQVIGQYDVREIEIDCPEHFDLISAQNRKIRFQLEVSRVWRPCDYSESNDCRLLGVQVYRN